MRQVYILFIALILSGAAGAQKKIKVLFIGDSYTSTNNLPLTVASIALAKGDTLVYDSNTPGGTTFQGQCSNTTTIAKIAEGGWDYVVLQGQSEETAFPQSQVEVQTYPYAHILDSLVHAADSCTETVFFLTWGHQNGDPPNCAAFPPICTYTGMQDSITASYLEMGQLDQATVAPVGEAWRSIVDTSRGFDMYLSDSTHPSIYGTYLAASVFYEILFQKSVLNDTFITVGIADSNAALLRRAAHATVSDSLSKWFSSGHIPVASFTTVVADSSVTVTSTSINGDVFVWNFGDGTADSATHATHTYSASGVYPVILQVYGACKTSSAVDTVYVTVLPTGISAPERSHLKVYPNPASNIIYVYREGLEGSNSAITLINVLGEIVRKVKASNNLTSISVTDLPGGIYTLSFEDRVLQLAIVR